MATKLLGASQGHYETDMMTLKVPEWQGCHDSGNWIKDTKAQDQAVADVTWASCGWTVSQMLGHHTCSTLRMSCKSRKLRAPHKICQSAIYILINSTLFLLQIRMESKSSIGTCLVCKHVVPVELNIFRTRTAVTRTLLSCKLSRLLHTQLVPVSLSSFTVDSLLDFNMIAMN